MPDEQTMRDHIEDLMIENNNLHHQLQQWKATATLFYERHDNRRNCSLITRCAQCDAYEALIQKEH